MSLPKITLKQLAVFASVYETGSTSQAALELCLSQSAVSSALAQLESRLGMPLFDRSGRRLEAHLYSGQLYAQTQAILSQVQSLEQYHQYQAGHIKIGASTTIGNYVLPKIIAALNRYVPDADIEVTIANTQEIVTKVEQLHVDIALVEATPHPNHVKVLSQQIWRDDQLVVFAKQDSRWLKAFKPRRLYGIANGQLKAQESLQSQISQASPPLAINQQISYCLLPEQVAQLPFIVRESGSGTRQIIDEKLLRHLPGVQVLMEVGQSEAIKRMVAADIGIGCLSQHVIESELAGGDLVQISVSGLELSRQWWLLWHNACHQSQLWQQFVEMITTKAYAWMQA